MDNLDNPIGTGTFGDVDPDWDSEDNWNAMLNSDNSNETDNVPDLYLPVGIVMFNPTKGILAIIMPDKGKVAGFRGNADNGLDSVILDESDLENIKRVLVLSALMG